MKRDSTCAAVLLVLSALFAISCSGPPEREQTVEAIRLLKRAPKAVRVDVTCVGEDAVLTYGDDEEWEAYLARLFEKEFDVSERIWFPPAADRQQDLSGCEPDVTVKVTIRAVEPRAQVDRRGAFLDVTAWLFIPFLPLFIDDVENEAGLEVTVDLLSHKNHRLSTPSVFTTMLDRYPFFSWQMLSVLIVPPFFYSDGRREHLAKSIKEDVRYSVATQLARFVKEKALGADELMTEPTLERSGDDWTLSFRSKRGHPLYRLTLCVDDNAWSESVSPDDGVDSPHRVAILRRDVGDSEFLRIVPRSTAGETKGYTLRLPRAPEPATPRAD